MTFEIERPFHIDVANHVLSGSELALNGSEQRAVEAISVDFFVFQELAGGDAASEFFRSEEKIFHSVTFRAARGTTGRADREMQVEASGYEVFDECIFAGSRRAGESNHFGHGAVERLEDVEYLFFDLF